MQAIESAVSCDSGNISESRLIVIVFTGAQRQKDAIREMATGGGPFGAPPAYDDDGDGDGDEYGHSEPEPEPEPVSDTQ